MRLKNRTNGDITWQNTINANPGDKIAFSVYYRNTVAGTTAENTKIRITFLSYKQSYIIPTVYLSADNAETVIDTASIDISASERLIFDNIALWYPDQSSNGRSISVSKTSNTVEANIGNIGACWRHQGHVVFEAVLSETLNNPDIFVEKFVKNLSKGQVSWSDTVEAKPLDKIAFKIRIKSTGNVVAEDVFVKDILPFNMTYLDNLKIDGVSCSSNIFSGININDILPGRTKTIIFETQIHGKKYFSYGQTILINTALAYNKKLTGRDTVTIKVNKSAVAGAATEVNTGFGNPLLDFLIIPFLISLAIIVIFKNQLFKFNEWLERQKKEKREYYSKKILHKKISFIKEKESSL